MTKQSDGLELRILARGASSFPAIYLYDTTPGGYWTVSCSIVTYDHSIAYCGFSLKSPQDAPNRNIACHIEKERVLKFFRVDGKKAGNFLAPNFSKWNSMPYEQFHAVTETVHLHQSIALQRAVSTLRRTTPSVLPIEICYPCGIYPHNVRDDESKGVAYGIIERDLEEEPTDNTNLQVKSLSPLKDIPSSTNHPTEFGQ